MRRYYVPSGPVYMAVISKTVWPVVDRTDGSVVDWSAERKEARRKARDRNNGKGES